MSKAVMLSIRPKWCEKIISGEKTVEVRKNRPKLETPFKCYIPLMQCPWCGAGIASTATRIWAVCTAPTARAWIAMCLQISGARMADGGRMPMPKTNPRRIPRTQADVDKAYSNGIVEGLSRGIDLMLYVLIDKHDAPMDDVQQLAGELNHAAQCVAEGYVTWADIRQMLKEYGVETALE